MGLRLKKKCQPGLELIPKNPAIFLVLELKWVFGLLVNQRTNKGTQYLPLFLVG